MMGSFFNSIVTLLFLAHVCLGQLIPRFENTETAVVNCGNLILEWRGGTPPYALSAVEDVLLGGKELQAIGNARGTQALWRVALPADTRSVRVTLTDARGNSAIPKAFRVAAGTDTSCITPTGLPSDSTALPSDSSTSSSVPSTSASNTSSQPTSSSTPTSTPTETPTNSNPPATTPSQTSTVTSISTVPGNPNPSAGANNTSGAAKTTTKLPTIGIVGIVAGGIIALCALIFLITCYIRRVRRKSDPLDTWDGAYDPESVFKATNQYNGANTGGMGVVPDTAPLWDPATSQVPVQQGGWNAGTVPPQNTAYGQTMYTNGAQYQYR